MILASFKGALAPSTPDKLIVPIAVTDASRVMAGDDAMKLLVAGPALQSIGPDSATKSAGDGAAPGQVAALVFASSDNLIRAIRDSDIVIKVSDPGAAADLLSRLERFGADEKLRTDEAYADFVG